MKLSRSFFTALLALLLVGQALGQVGVLRGKVVDEQGNPIKDVQIKMQGLDVRRNFEVKTNDKGEYLHAGVFMQGAYRIVAEKEGYQSDYIEGVSPGFGMNDPRGEHNFTLKEGESTKLDFEMTDEEREALKKQQEQAEQQQAQSEEVRQAFSEGINFYNLGDYEQAILSFKTALEKDEQQPAIWANLANAYSKQKKYEEAVQSYDKALALKQDPVFFQNLGGIYAEAGDIEKSREAYEKAASLSAATDPKSAAANYYNMGVTLINAGRSQEAIDALTKAVTADSQYAEAHYQLGILYLGVNNLEDAIKHLNAYVEILPTGPNAEVAKQLVVELGK